MTLGQSLDNVASYKHDAWSVTR